MHGSSPQLRLKNYSPEALFDRHERQLTLIKATGLLGDPPFDVLDLGAGSGVTSVWAARKGWNVTASDIASDHLDVLVRHLEETEPELKGRITIQVADAVNGIGLPDESYDIAYLKDLLEHVVDYHLCLKSALAKLRAGGFLYVSTTNVWCPIQAEFHGVGPYSWYPPFVKRRIIRYALEKNPKIINYTTYPALHWFSRNSLRKALLDAGFSKVWDVYDLLNTRQDFTRRTRLIFPLAMMAKRMRPLRYLVDFVNPGLTMVAMK
jgi:2-polyprenyl-3-methyl-5-hydroxy-6-metoxy-1,4-benzoquinol methylase